MQLRYLIKPLVLLANFQRLSINVQERADTSSFHPLDFESHLSGPSATERALALTAEVVLDSKTLQHLIAFD